MRAVVHRIIGRLGERWQSSGLRSFCTGNRANVDSKQRSFRVTLIEGEGSGPTVCTAVRKIFKAAGVQVEWDRHTLHAHWDPYIGRKVLNPDVVQSAFETGLVLYGSSSAGSMNNEDSVGSASLTLHKLLNASVGVRIFTSIDGHQPFGPVRMVNIRDNVSGEYSEIEHTVVPGKYLQPFISFHYPYSLTVRYVLRKWLDIIIMLKMKAIIIYYNCYNFRYYLHNIFENSITGIPRVLSSRVFYN